MNYRIKQPGPKISDPDLQLLERELGYQLPSDYREFLLQTNGGSCGDLEFQKANGQIDSVKTFYGLRGESETDDIIWSRRLLKVRLGAGRFLPMANTPFGDVIIVDLGSGGLFLWIHDNDDAEIEILAENFADFWNALKEPEPEAPECNFRNWQNYSPNWRGKYGNSVVEAAAINGRVDIVKASIVAGYSPGEAMRCAAMNGCMEVVDFLVQSGFSLNQICSDGRTPLDWTLWNEKYATALRSRGAKTSKELKGETASDDPTA